MTATQFTVQQAFEHGLVHHQAGRLAEAERLYGAILKVDPHHAGALHLLGVIAHQVGRNETAVELIRKAITINPNRAAWHSNLALALHALGRFDEAVTAYDAALRIKPDFAEAYSNLGNALAALGRLDESLAAHHTALRLKPDFAEAYSNLGNALKDLGRLDEAVAACDAALRLKPDCADAHYNRGNSLYDLGHLDDAVAAYDAALRLGPDDAKVHCNRGVALHDLARFDEAVAACGAALRLKPDLAEAYSNQANSLRELGRFDEAVAAYATALRLKPDFAEAEYNDAMTRLLLGDFSTGWAKYESRRRGGSRKLKPRNFVQPQWRGEDLTGRHILLHAEQGLGDAIQFYRYAPLVVARGGRVILEAPPPLLRLFSGLAGVERAVAAGDPLPEFDCCCSLMSLPSLFGTDSSTIPIPPPVAFSGVDLGRIAAWRDRLAHGDGLRVGIVWQGNPAHQGDRWRSVPVHCFAPLARVAGARLISLQKGYGLDQLNTLPDGMGVVDLGPDYASGDFAETAAVVMNLDLVISIDSAVAHLAGSLGRPTWVVLPFIPDWRWLLDREDSPWYPSLRLFRQSRRGEWGGVFDRMAAELARMIAPT